MRKIHIIPSLFLQKIIMLGFIYRILILQKVTCFAKFTTHFVVTGFLLFVCY